MADEGVRRVFGTGNYRFRLVEGWGIGPQGRIPGGAVSSVAVDSHDQVYVLVRASVPVLVYDREGRFLKGWGEGLFTQPHSVWMSPDDILYVTDRMGHAVRKCTMDGEVLATWGTPGEAGNFDRAGRENMLGKTSRKRLGDVLRIFRQRFFDDPDVGTALVMLTQSTIPSQWLDPLLYFFAAQNDHTLRDIVVEVLYPRHLAGYSDVTVDYIARAIRNWVAEGKTGTVWNEETLGRVARGAMATLRDFGVLEGAANKRLTPIYLPTPAFALIAMWLQSRERSGERVLHSDDWKLFFLPVEGVERFFIEAHQEHLLNYQAAGSVIRIEFPTASLPEYAHVLIERAR